MRQGSRAKRGSDTNVAVKLPAGVIARHELGQHFLLDERILCQQIEYAGITSADTVLEIGAGLGNLTAILAQTSAKVVAIEADSQFEDRLEKLRSMYPNLDLIWGDAMQVTFPEFTKAVANLPYRVALPLVFKILDHSFHTAVLIVQVRLARRLCARPGEPGYSRISVAAQRVASLRFLETVKNAAFAPPPAVDSAMIRLRRTRPRFAIPSDEQFKRFLDAIFLRRTAALRDALGIFGRGPIVTAAINETPKDLLGRIVETLTPAEFGFISCNLDKFGVILPPISNELKRKSQKYY